MEFIWRSNKWDFIVWEDDIRELFECWERNDR